MPSTRRLPALESEFTKALHRRDAPIATGTDVGKAAVQEYAAVDRAHYAPPSLGTEAGFKAVYPQKYYLEFYSDWKSGGQPEDIFSLPYVNSITSNNPLALERTWTLGDLYEEHTGFRQRQFVLTGRSGFDAGDLYRFFAFRNFIETYAEVSAENKGAFVRLKDTRLVLNFPFEGESYFCSVIDFTYTRDTATTRMSFAYRITLLTQGWATRKWHLPKNIGDYLSAKDPNKDHTNHWHNCHRYATITEVGGDVALAPGAHIDVENAARGADPRAYSQILPPRGDTTRYLEDGPPGLTQVPTDPDYYRDLYWVVGGAIAATAVAFALMDPDKQLRVSKQFWLRTMWYNELRMQSATYLGVQFCGVDLYANLITTGEDFDLEVGGNFGPAGFVASLGSTGKRVPPARQSRAPGVVPVRPEPVIATTTVAGDTSLADIAIRELGNAALWTLLASMNGWRDSRTQPNGAPIAPGVTVLLPAPQGTPAPTDQDLYGTDLLLDDGDLFVIGDDVATVSGPQNLLQNLTNRMLTDRGTNATFPAYGMQARVGTATEQDTVGQVMSDARLQAMADHRVRTLSKLDVQQQADRLLINFEVEAITRARVQASFSRPGTV